MELILVIIAIGAVIAYGFLKNAAERTSPPAGTTPRAVHTAERFPALRYLDDAWRERERARAAGAPCDPTWWWDAPTDSQRRRLAEHLEDRGVKLSGFSPATKGAYSDLIGWFEDPDPEEEETLRFFKVPMRGMNQTKARYELRRLMADPENKARWGNRPVTAEQKEFAEWFGMELPKGTTAIGAAQLIAEREENMTEADQKRYRDWRDYQGIVLELNDQDERETYEIRKPSRAAIRKALDALLAEGHTYEEISMDLELIAARLPQAKRSTRVLSGEVDERGNKLK
ncbi:MAG: hypothetical protein MUF80_10785 [Burkholderiales bacterium]|nr:hypothetical protein [Burkholderiales bacterium]